MGNKNFKHQLIRKLIVAGVFAGLTIGAAISLNYVNNELIIPNEGFISEKLCRVNTVAKNNLGDRLAVEIEQEGIVLAKNENNVLPLDKSVKKVNVFGYNVMEWVISNSGSGSADAGKGQRVWGILDALDSRGISYNKDVINYYKNWATPRDRGTKSYGGTPYSTIYRLTNPSLSKNSDYKTIYDAAKSDTDTAIVCIGRYGGEHLDIPHKQVNNYKASPTRNNDRGYLEITLEEEELLRAVGQDYDKVIVIINSTNVMQMDFMRDIPGLDACLLVGPTGTVGAKAIPQVIWGDVNPSGRTADTWPMKHKYSASYYTIGYWPTNSGTDGNKSSTEQANYYNNVPSNANLANGIDTANFSDYYEGIYVGYKWFETADAMHFWDASEYGGYDNVVAYPFGFGKSYSEFEWELVESLPAGNSTINKNEDIELQVKVTNKSERAGRDVVEVYLDAQYYPGEIEKASVRLVGFQKTSLLEKDESEIVTIKLNTRDFMSFDCYDANKDGHAGYELDRGDYNIKLMTDAHRMKSGVIGGNTIRFNVPNTIHVDEDPETGNHVQPLFTDVTTEGNQQTYKPIDGVPLDGNIQGQTIEYMSRNNFAATFKTALNPCRNWVSGLQTSDTGGKTSWSDNLSNQWDTATTDVFGKAVKSGSPRFGEDNGLRVMEEDGTISEIGRQLAADYDDPVWEDLLDQLTWQDGTTIPKQSSYSRPGMQSVGLTKLGNKNFEDAEGASQVGASYGDGKRFTAYPDPCLQAQTWNNDMLYLFGLSESKDMTNGGKDFLYGPASNIHRSPYGGRHAEYHSEDGFLAGQCLSHVTKGLADGGKNGFIKHFVMNDTEFHRVGLFVWTTEQALREIYLRPFEEAIKNGEATAVMSSFNRIGAVWTGGSQALCQGVLRNEWGFKGMMITDYTENGTLQNANQMFRAGGNYVLHTSDFKDPGQSNATSRFKWRVRESAKQAIWGTIRPLYVNYEYNANPANKALISNAKTYWVWWKPVLWSLEVFVIVALAYGFVAALLPSDPDFRSGLKQAFAGKRGGEEPNNEPVKKKEEDSPGVDEPNEKEDK